MSDSSLKASLLSKDRGPGASDSFMKVLKNISILNFFLTFLLAITLLSPLISSVLTFDGSSSFVKPEFMIVFLLKIATIGSILVFNIYSVKSFNATLLNFSVISSIIIASLFISFNFFTLFFNSLTSSFLIYFDNLLYFMVFNFIFLALSSLLIIVILIFGITSLKSIKTYSL